MKPMRRNNFILMFFLLFCGNIFSQNNELSYPKYDSLKREYQIVDIKEIGKAYLIKVEDNTGYVFTIISTKCKKQEKTKIETRKKYDLLFYSIYPPPEEDVIVVGWSPIYHRISVNGILIKFQGDFDTGILVTTPNIKGLYYVK